MTCRQGKRDDSMTDRFVRLATAAPTLALANIAANTDSLLAAIQQADADQADLIVFPELSLTGASCADLFLSQRLQQAAVQGLMHLARKTAGSQVVSLVGLPLAAGQALYSVVAVIQNGQVLGLVPKRQLSVDQQRVFQPGPDQTQLFDLPGQVVPLGSHLLFCWSGKPAVSFAVELGAERLLPLPGAARAALAGALIVCNPSALPEASGRPQERRDSVQHLSRRLICAYVLAEAGRGESTTDRVYAGHQLVYENGRLLAENKPFAGASCLADIDPQALLALRQRSSAFQAGAEAGYDRVFFQARPPAPDLRRHVSKTPFIPAENLAAHCEEVTQIQANGLAGRLSHVPGARAVLGLSGGLDSSLALLVILRTFDLLKRPRRDILAVSLPGPGSSQRTRNNARALAQACGVSFQELSIDQAVADHLAALGHPAGRHDTTFENAQARERMQILMDLANQQGGLVIGTGSLSELALGWTTYNGDHMSMYDVNCSVPKTLIPSLLRHLSAGTAWAELVEDIIDTPVSPELLPEAAETGGQQTEQLIGPYLLHDFFLYYFLTFGSSPDKILRLATAAFAGDFDAPTIKGWLGVFFKRFFSQQFKRSCSPDGPQTGALSLSPRGAWSMPSDAVSDLWTVPKEP